MTIFSRLDDADTNAAVSRRFGLLLADPPPRPPHLGLEQEYALIEHEKQIDFGPVVDRTGFSGKRLHPTNSRAFQTPSGLLLMADGSVAEAASPPVPLANAFVETLEQWAALGRTSLEETLEADQYLFGGSTHLSVEVDQELNDQLCRCYAETFAPALMLLMDNTDSPGLLIRPRPNRTELCGEFVQGRRLRAAIALAAGSVLATQDWLRGEPDAEVPPALKVTLERGRQRKGWYVDRRAFGPDLYRKGRTARLRQGDGTRVSAQAHLQTCWRIARAALVKRGIEVDDLSAADIVVAGLVPLPSEYEDLDDAAQPIPRSDATLHDRILNPGKRPDFDVEPVSGTWDYTAFEVRSDTPPVEGPKPAATARRAIVNVPAPQIESFLDELDRGTLDGVIGEYLAAEPSDRVLASSEQTTTPGIYDSVDPNPQLLPTDYTGVGPGSVSESRPDKLVGYPPTGTGHSETPRSGGGARWLWLAALVGLVVILIALISSGGGEQAPPTAPPASSETGGGSVPSDSTAAGEAGSTDTTPTETTPQATGPTSTTVQQAVCNVGGDSPPGADAVAIAAAAGDVVTQARLAGEVTYTGYALGSHIFTMGVAGDGETVSTHPDTLWYNPRFVVNHDENNVPLGPDAFTVDIGWSNDGTPGANTRDSSFQALREVEGTVVWLDPSTLQVTVSGADVDDVEVISVRMELVGRIGELDGPTLANIEGNGCWSPG